MIIAVKGFGGHNNGSVEIASTIATMNAIARKSKTLVLQYIGKSANCIENILIGKRLGLSLDQEDFGFSDDGMDALLRSMLSENAKLKKSDFDHYVFSVFEKAENLLDIAFTTEKTDLISTLDDHATEQFEALIEAASKIYQTIVILLPSNCSDFSNDVCKRADSVVLAMRQEIPYNLEEHYETEEGKNKTFGVINHFDIMSTYKLSTLKKTVKFPLFILPYETGFVDAVRSLNLLTFLRRNKIVEQEDIHYYWSTCVEKLMKALVDGEVEEDDGTLGYEKVENVPEKKEESVQETLPEMEWQTQTVKKGLFRKKEITTLVEKTDTEPSTQE